MERMKASVARLRESKFHPDVYGFDDPDTLAGLAKGLAAVSDHDKPKLIVRMGMKEDGSPEAWIEVKSEKGSAYAGNISFTCPPRPPADCDE